MNRLNNIQVFSKEWFFYHQKSLLYLLNHRIIGNVVRQLLLIDNLEYPIIKFLPNSFHYKIDRNKFIADFRTHDKWGKLLYHRWILVWQLFHQWDRLVNKIQLEKLNLGFDTLPFYPDAAPETTSVDGYIGRASVDETLATIVAGAGTVRAAGGTDGNALQLTASATTNRYSVLRRGFFLFDTSTLNDSAVISEATFGLVPNSNSLNDYGGTPYAVLVSSNPASNTALEITDFGNIGSTEFGKSALSNYTTGGYRSITLNATGIENINLTGVSKFGLRLDWDINGALGVGASWGSGRIARLDTIFADTAGTSSDPKLEVTYTLQPYIPSMNIQNLMSQIRM